MRVIIIVFYDIIIFNSNILTNDRSNYLFFSLTFANWNMLNFLNFFNRKRKTLSRHKTFYVWIGTVTKLMLKKYHENNFWMFYCVFHFAKYQKIKYILNLKNWIIVMHTFVDIISAYSSVLVMHVCRMQCQKSKRSKSYAYSRDKMHSWRWKFSRHRY